MAVGSIIVPQFPLPPAQYDQRDQQEFRSGLRTALTDVERIVQALEAGYGALTYALEDLSDVDAYSSIGSGEVLMWDGDSWLHRTLAEASIADYTATNTWSSSGGQLAETGTAGNAAWRARVTGDSDDRWKVSVGGIMSFGPGNAAGDTNLYRNSANELKTDDAFSVGGALDVTGASTLGSTLEVSGATTLLAYLYEDVFADVARIRLRRANGSSGSPSTVTAGEWLGGVQYWGYDGSDYRLGVNLRAIASETFSGGTFGTDLVLYAVPDGGTTPLAFITLDATANATKIAESVYSGRHLMMGNYHFWVDGSGRLRIKNGAPSSATDGTVVGTQS